jgi:hypothetical protein
MFQLADGTRLSYQFTPDRASSEREPDEHEPLVSISGTGIAGDPVAVELSFHGRRGEARRIKAVVPYAEWVRGMRFLWADIVPIAAIDVIAGDPPDLFESAAILAAKYAGSVAIRVNTRRAELPAEVLASLLTEVRDEVAQALHVGYLLGQAAHRVNGSAAAAEPSAARSAPHVAR